MFLNKQQLGEYLNSAWQMYPSEENKTWLDGKFYFEGQPTLYSV